MIGDYHYVFSDISDSVSEKDKEKEPYLTGNINRWISTLVEEKHELRTAYNYYHGKFYIEEFRYLEDMYGVEAAENFHFIPLIRKHIEVLKGMLLETDPRTSMSVTCKDDKTLTSIMESRSQELLKSLIDKIQVQLQNSVMTVKGQANPEELQDQLAEEQLEDLKEYYNSSWQSAYEEAGQTFMDHILNSRSIDFMTKMVDLFEDLLVSGFCNYRVISRGNGRDPVLEVVNPLHIFYNKNTNDRYTTDCTAVVHRFYRTPEEIVNQFGHLMGKEELDEVQSMKTAYGGRTDFFERDLIETATGLGSRSGYRDTYSKSIGTVLECFHVEWKSNNPYLDEDGNKQMRMDRYSGYRIGPSLYLDMGRDDVVRERGKLFDCPLSYQGVANTDRNGHPYSFVMITKTLQDKYNLYHFLRDNTVSHAGNKGIYVDMSAIPAELGSNEEERLLSFIQQLKSGIALLNSSQDGAENLMNTIFQGYDLSLDYNTVQAYNALIEVVEQTVSTITGVPRQMLAKIEQRDAVGNVQVGIKQGLVITKPLFMLIENIMANALTDMINQFRVSYPNGYKGSILLPEGKRKLIDLAPEYYSMTDFDTHVVSGPRQHEIRQTVNTLVMEMVKAQAIGMDTALDLVTSNSITHKKESMSNELKKNQLQQLQQMSQQAEELQKQLEQVSSQNEKLQNKINQDKQVSQKMQERKINAEIEAKQKELELKERMHRETMDLKKEHIKAEVAQLFDNNPYNNEIKDI